MPDVVVIGSVNMDLVVVAPQIPLPGQTVLGGDLATIPGGKGANQAVAAARLGASVAFIGRVGDDAFAQTLRGGLVREGIDCRYLLTTSGVASGVALIVVSKAGQNAICVAGGANRRLSPDDVERAEELVAKARVCVLQLEIPQETAARAIAVAKNNRGEVILDPAPAPDTLSSELLNADIITPNESEVAKLLGETEACGDWGQTAGRLRARGPRAVVLKLGSEGCYLSAPDGDQHIPAHAVKVVDTTAAGDAFTAALAVARAEGRSLGEAAAFANAAGALACTRFGAQPSAPTRAEVEALASR